MCILSGGFKGGDRGSQIQNVAIYNDILLLLLLIVTIPNCVFCILVIYFFSVMNLS